MRAAKTKAGGGSGLHRLAANKVHSTIRPDQSKNSEHGEKHSARGMDYGTKVQETEMDGWVSKKALGRARGGACKAKGGSAGKWIQKAISHPGAEKKAAKRAGVSTHEYMEEHKHDSGKAGARARLGLRLSAMSKHKS